jgi:ribosomal protein S18 acetylase RimI-like enzyme
MPAYRFCRTDDIDLLVDALNRCWGPSFPDEPPTTPVAFKRSIRDLQVWCSSCMVAFAGSDPVGVLIGAKRPGSTLVHKIAVHPDHRRQGHARHLLESLSSKLAILGPRRLVAEVPETLAPACALFSASGYTQEAVLTDYILERRGPGPVDGAGKLVIPFTVDDLAANGLLGEDPQRTCWERSIDTLTARKEDIAGLAVADERIEACILYMRDRREPDRTPLADHVPWGPSVKIVLLRSFVEDGGASLQLLVSRLCARGSAILQFPKVHPAEVSKRCLEMLGFRGDGTHRLYATTA